MAADLLAKLRSITPFPGTAVFAASAIPTGMSGTTEIRRARLLLVVRLVNKSSDPTIPVVVVAMMLQALHDTRSVWQ